MTESSNRNRLLLTGALAAGAVLGAAGILALRAPAAQAQIGPTAPPNGRYVIIHSPHARADTLMIDSLTGRTWRQIIYTDLNGDPPVWRPLDQVDSNAQMQELVARHGLKGPQQAPPQPKR